jgi:hypothetical protein
MANGRVEEANAVFQICRDRLRGTVYSEHYIRVLRQWADGLLQNGRPAESVRTIEEGLRVTRDAEPPESHCRFLIMRARAAVDIGDLSAAESALAIFEGTGEFDDEELHQERIASAVLRARIQKQRHNTDGLHSQLETAVERFVASAKSVDASVHGYLWIGRCEELRRELHLAARDEPKLGYGIELFWRDAFSLLGADGRDGSSPALVDPGFATSGESADHPSLLGRLVSRADAACRAVSKYGGTHCEYFVIDNEVWRWTCSRGDIRRDVLDMGADELEEVAGRAWFAMSLDPGSADAAPDAGLVEDLRTLSGVLLPPEVLQRTPPEQPPLLFVSADGFIGRLPFETFNVGNPGEYLPLISIFDVAYIRHVRELAADMPASPGLVVASGSSGHPSRNVCPAPLTEVFEEGERVISNYPDAELLMNESATKANVLSRWQEASFLYLATHLLEDPDVMYMALVPLAPAGKTDAPSMSYLDMADIRSADFSRCKTVVLDQCSSGKPYVGARNTSPGLASAFLDAGAATVIQTFWNVRDEDAASFMPAIAGELESSSVHLIRVLCNAKRAHMKSESGVRHPFRWAPYAIQLGRL